MNEPLHWLTLLLSGPNPSRWPVIRAALSLGLQKDELLTVLVAPSEESEARSELADQRFRIVLWTMEDGKIRFSEALVEGEANLLLYSGNPFPDELIEAIAKESQSGVFEISRVITQVHCGWCKESREAKAWFDACIHFSDLVLLDNRGDVEDAWVRDFQEHYRKEHYPCYFDLVKKGVPKHPEWIFDSQPRRLSLIFDPDDLSGMDLAGYEIEGDEPEEEEELTGDPYLRRNAAGERERKVRPLPS
ncbi:MAG: hypothetical protein AAGJ81_03095 [Verrucomicrobiota bacterium]